MQKLGATRIRCFKKPTKLSGLLQYCQLVFTVIENKMLKHFIIVEEMANPSAHGLKYFKSFENN